MLPFPFGLCNTTVYVEAVLEAMRAWDACLSGRNLTFLSYLGPKGRGGGGAWLGGGSATGPEEREVED